MSDILTLPRLAAMYLTRGHRIPDEILARTAAAGESGRSDHELDEWECPLDGSRDFGASRGTGSLRLVPPEY